MPLATEKYFCDSPGLDGIGRLDETEDSSIGSPYVQNETGTDRYTGSDSLYIQLSLKLN